MKKSEILKAIKNKRHCVVLTGMRFGSSLLNKLLDQSPQVLALGEFVYERDYHHSGDTGIAGASIVVTKDTLYYAQRYGTGKTGDNMKHLDAMIEEAQIITTRQKKRIILARNFRDVFLSCQNYGGLENISIEQVLGRYETISDYVTRLSDRKEKDNTAGFHLVKYEDLVAHPLEELNKMYKYLGVEPVKSINFHKPLKLDNGIGDDKLRHTEAVHTDSVNKRVGNHGKNFKLYEKDIAKAEKPFKY